MQRLQEEEELEEEVEEEEKNVIHCQKLISDKASIRTSQQQCIPLLRLHLRLLLLLLPSSPPTSIVCVVA